MRSIQDVFKLRADDIVFVADSNSLCGLLLHDEIVILANLIEISALSRTHSFAISYTYITITIIADKLLKHLLAIDTQIDLHVHLLVESVFDFQKEISIQKSKNNSRYFLKIQLAKTLTAA